MKQAGNQGEASELESFMRGSFKIVVAIVGSICVLMPLDTARHNEALLAEVNLLRQAFSIWDSRSDDFVQNLEEAKIRGRRGFPCPPEGSDWETRIESGVGMSWTNSVLGQGRLVLSRQGDVFWMNSDDEVRRLEVPGKGEFSFKWFLRNPGVRR